MGFQGVSIVPLDYHYKPVHAYHHLCRSRKCSFYISISCDEQGKRENSCKEFHRDVYCCCRIEEENGSPQGATYIYIYLEPRYVLVPVGQEIITVLLLVAWLSEGTTANSVYTARLRLHT